MKQEYEDCVCVLEEDIIEEELIKNRSRAERRKKNFSCLNRDYRRVKSHELKCDWWIKGQQSYVHYPKSSVRSKTNKKLEHKRMRAEGKRLCAAC